MNKCRHCGAFVPVEKAFCPNCSEPMEPEEAPNRAASSSSDMMATLRDDPEHYRELLAQKKKQLTATQAETPAAGEPRAAASVTGSSSPQGAPDLAPPAKNNKRKLVFAIGALAVLIILVALLLVLKVF